MEETDYLNCLEEIVRDQVVSFTAKGKTYNIYPISLGKKLLINRQLQNIQFDEKLDKQIPRHCSVESLKMPITRCLT